MEIKEDKENGFVFINGRSLFGFIDGKCAKCNLDRIYSYDYDAYFCINCNKWLESQCSDPDCDYCKKRPKEPFNMIKTL